MNYSKIYESLISRCKNREILLEEYTEKHHIIPRCMGGSDDLDNIVILTAREHFIAHLLLAKIHKGHFGLTSAMVMMCTDKSGNRLTNRLYSLHRKLFSEVNSIFFKEYWKNNPHPKGMLGKHHTEETKERISDSVKLSATTVKINKFSLEGDFIEKFESLLEAAKSVNGNASNIKYCAEGKFQYAYGFRWSYSLNPKFDTIKPRKYKGARGKIFINNGVKNKLINSTESIPIGWVRGRIKIKEQNDRI
ncbi:TPA: NUMOD1 domain-containing DNA-binding protein [Vibrio cholerae]